jgi:hypothetical protein
MGCKSCNILQELSASLHKEESWAYKRSFMNNFLQIIYSTCNLLNNHSLLSNINYYKLIDLTKKIAVC